ncbi:short-chain dehydrogenase/reductase SDR [Geodermatophilus obscurus DSM 43160]|uniref:Short-chain dehydrogenase/reductase SDR n=1 Tax=Geodermatophilus obscurus (strain ATCC 25078 / DSM 43160 / JCM 3152 / CCUG 61914 / KCC A-0152 / KCTC 9177 / NBRC 13315 / NRRL B-3577 / G-20) TaxID=526225 RepID=D2S6S5_GEOOG|nr:short-chain dehydrogenase/reductase SDR [Geodermatophilus obscurus DSM 43160]
MVLVTGGSRGIGAATARAAAAAGWSVALTYRDDEAAAAAVVTGIEAAGGTACAVRADVSVEDDVLAAFAAAAEGLGPVTGLVANAGIVGQRARVDELTAERVQRMLAVNVLGTVLCCREAVLRMSTRHGGSGGSIVLVSSAASRLGSPGEYVDYAASKGAVDTLGVGLAREVAGEGIRVNVVRPGIIETEIHASGGQPDRVARVGPTVPMGRAGRAEEVADAVLWLLGDGAGYCTGSLLDVAGGR